MSVFSFFRCATVDNAVMAATSPALRGFSLSAGEDPRGCSMPLRHYQIQPCFELPQVYREHEELRELASGVGR